MFQPYENEIKTVMAAGIKEIYENWLFHLRISRVHYGDPLSSISKLDNFPGGKE